MTMLNAAFMNVLNGVPPLSTHSPQPTNITRTQTLKQYRDSATETTTTTKKLISLLN